MNHDFQADLGKHISHFCGNGFVNDQFGHSTHYVSHILELDNGLNCKTVRRGRAAGANIRTLDVFVRCPKVGSWQDADTSKTLLVFSLEPEAVQLERKFVSSVSKKGVGVFNQGSVYFYSNSENQVVEATPEAFLKEQEEIHGKSLALFYGLLPGSDLELNVDLSGSREVSGRKIVTDPDSETDQTRVRYYASVDDGERFLLGWSVRYSRYLGLQLLNSGKKYSGDDYVEQCGHWAYILDYIGHCESANHFNIVNTYDRANFTFGFFQLAAHTPNDNLILFFRRLLQLPEAKDYFPELELREGKVHRINENGSFTNLERETDRQIPDFMTYLNPDRKKVDKQELLHAARLIHWTDNSEACRALQVQMAFDITTHKVERRYARKYQLEGLDDITLGIICDIHHNGRGTFNQVREVLESSRNPETRVGNLLKFKDDNPTYRNRNRDLAERIQQLRDDGRIGHKIYDPTQNGFIDGNLSEV